MRRLRLLHAIHDFLPRHRAGSEIYTCDLARELSRRHDVFILTAEYDPTATHGVIRWRAYDGLPVIEIVNNWAFDRFEETYSSPRINSQLAHVLEMTRPDVLHVHNLLNLSFDLPRLARERSIPSVATLHDYALVCASGGQRVHVAEAHVCDVIDPERCSRCFGESPFHTIAVGGALSRAPGGRAVGRAAMRLRRRFPLLLDAIAHRVPATAISEDDITTRLARARQVFETIDLFISPSAALAAEFVRLGIPPGRMRVSDYGFASSSPRKTVRPHRPVRIGFVGTLVWLKGAHVLIEAAARLRGDFELRIWGSQDVHPEYAARLQRQAAGLPAIFGGSFERRNVPDIYADLDVLVVPSLWSENSPLVIHEAFMHGVAVVAARKGGIPELVVDGVNGLTFDAYSSTQLAAALQRLIDDPDLAIGLARAAPAVKTIADDAHEWELRYEELLASKSRRPASAS